MHTNISYVQKYSKIVYSIVYTDVPEEHRRGERGPEHVAMDQLPTCIYVHVYMCRVRQDIGVQYSALILPILYT